MLNNNKPKKQFSKIEVDLKDNKYLLTSYDSNSEFIEKQRRFEKCDCRLMYL